MKLKNDHGLWINEDNGRCLSYLMNFQGKGIYSPDGKVEITLEQANTHNRLLSEAELKGLDENCQIGQRGSFYYTNNKVSTFIGNIVTENVRVNGNSITFTRKGKVYRGRLKKEFELFNFKRIS